MMKELRPAFSVIGHALNKLGKNKDLSKGQKQQVIDKQQFPIQIVN